MKVTEVIYFGIIYNLIFLGYYVSNGFLTILYPNEAFISFAVFYGVYCIFSLISPWILNRLGIKTSLIVSSLTFVIYVGVIASKIPILMLIGSGICGAGNALIWLAQGYWMSLFPSENKGLKIGLFYGIFYANILLGNVIGLIVLFVSSIDVMLWVMLGINSVGFVLTFFTPSRTFQNEKFSIKNVFTVVKINQGYLMVGLFLVQAVALNVTYQIVPLSIINTQTEQNINIYTGITFIAYGCASMGFSLISGKIYDKFGKYPVIITYLFFELSCLIGILLLNIFNHNLASWIPIGFVRGISDNAINTIINITIVSNYSNLESGSFFALYRFIYALSYTVFAILVAYIPYQYYLLMTGIIVIISFVIFLFYRDTVKLNEGSLEEQFDNNVVKL